MKIGFKHFFQDRKSGFFVAFGTALLTVVLAIVYFITMRQGNLFSLPVFLLVLLGPVAYLVLTLVGMPRTGTAVMTGTTFAAFILYLCGVFQFIYDEINVVAMGGTFSRQFCICAAVAVMLLLATVLSNIGAWLPHNKNGKEANHE